MPSIMDHSKYRFENFEGRPNVWIGYHLNQTYTSVRMQPLVLEAARIMFTKAPKNTYVFTGPQSNNEIAHMYRCTVERDGDQLGYMAHAQGRKGASVMVDNPRIRAERDRGGPMVTSDTKRAAALALKKFLPVSSAEALLKSHNSMRDTLKNLIAEKTSRKTQVFRSSSERILEYIERHWQAEGVAFFHKIGLPQSDIDRVNEALADHARLATLRAASAKGLTFVMQKDDTLYAVPLDVNGYSSDLHQRAYSFDDAPDPIRIGVSMLKVTETEGEYIPDVGMKLGDGYAIFYDLDTTEDEASDDT